MEGGSFLPRARHHLSGLVSHRSATSICCSLQTYVAHTDMSELRYPSYTRSRFNWFIYRYEGGCDYITLGGFYDILSRPELNTV